MKTKLIFTLFTFLYFGIPLNAQNGPGGIGDTSGDSNLQLWLRADDCINCSTGDILTTWIDQSGAGNHVSSNSINESPRFNESAANGFPGIDFSGTQYFQTDGATSSFSQAEATVFIVALGDMDGTLFASAIASWNHEMLLFNQNAYHHTSSGNFTLLEHQCLGDIPSNEALIISAVFGKTPEDLSYGVNALESTEPLMSPGTAQDYPEGDRIVTIGQRAALVSSEYLEGTIFEVIAYRGILPSEHRMQVEEYLKCKYQIENTTCSSLPPSLNNEVSQDDFTLTAIAAGQEYQWVDCDNNNEPIPGATEQSFTATENGTYAVLVSNQLCTTVMSDCFALFPVGIDEMKRDFGLEIFPNPTTDILQINRKNEGTISVDVLDSLGRLLLSDTTVEQQLSMDVGHLVSGVYFVLVTIEGRIRDNLIKDFKKKGKTCR